MVENFFEPRFQKWIKPTMYRATNQSYNNKNNNNNKSQAGYYIGQMR